MLTLLRRAAMQLRRLGGGLAVVCSQPDLRRLIDLTLLSQTFPVFATRDEALRDWR
jgi:anti-anti-sigma regulatory factor